MTVFMVRENLWAGSRKLPMKELVIK